MRNTPQRWLVALALAGHAVAAQAAGYTFSLIELPGDGYTTATTINAAGQVIGSGGPDGSAQHPRLWLGGVTSTLALPPASTADAQGINNTGQIVGALTGSGSNSQATLWMGANATNLALPQMSSSTARSINDAGDIVGDSTFGGGLSNATLWRNGAVIVLPGVGGQARAINNAGQIAGVYAVTEAGSTGPTVVAYQAARWDNYVLSTLGGPNSQAYDINDAGVVVGEMFSSEGYIRPVRWDGTVATDLGTLAGEFAAAYGINNAGQIVGSGLKASIFDPASTFEQRAFLWDGPAIIDLTSLLDSETLTAGWVLESANDINDQGWIVGSAYNTLTDARRGFVLAPVPEPETWAMLLAGLGLIGTIARRRVTIV